MDNLANQFYSVIPEKDAEEFLLIVNNKINSIKSHVELLKCIELGDMYPTDESCYELFKIAIATSN